ncbi:MAG: RNA polymerase subunit sigma [Phycisphaerae bacterium SM1_79]|nr:MAG: RNA polymerase subunit sigma [Phycisphaerae bacterium SM1_79]
MTDVTRILNAIEKGDAKAADELLPLVYEELRILAAQKMAKELPGQTLQATALVHEAYLRLVGEDTEGWKSRGHFFGAAAEAMRRILVERARMKQRIKHGGEHHRIEMEQFECIAEQPSEELLALDEALSKLSEQEPLKANLVKLRYFAGLTAEQAAEVLNIAKATADRYWAYARAWLFNEISKSGYEKNL